MIVRILKNLVDSLRSAAKESFPLLAHGWLGVNGFDLYFFGIHGIYVVNTAFNTGKHVKSLCLYVICRELSGCTHLCWIVLNCVGIVGNMHFMGWCTHSL